MNVENESLLASIVRHFTAGWRIIFPREDVRKKEVVKNEEAA